MNDPITTIDAKGRKLELRVLDPADMLDLMEAAEGASSNPGFVRYAMITCSVKAIDGIPVPFPTNKAQMKTLARQLGNDGFVAASKALFGDDGAAEHVDQTAETAKN